MVKQQEQAFLDEERNYARLASGGRNISDSNLTPIKLDNNESTIGRSFSAVKVGGSYDYNGS